MAAPKHSPESKTMLYTTATGAAYPESLKQYVLPLPELLRLHTHITNAAVGAFIFLTPGSTLLLIRRSLSEQTFPGLWEVPGGGVESPPVDETLLDAVVREAREETGLSVTRINRCYGWTEFEGRFGRIWRKWNFEVEVAETRGSVVLEPLEHDAWMWVDGREAFDAAGLNITAEKQREAILEAFRIRGEEGVGEVGTSPL